MSVSATDQLTPARTFTLETRAQGDYVMTLLDNPPVLDVINADPVVTQRLSRALQQR